MYIKFITKDGIVLQNRKTSSDCYYINEYPDTAFIDYSLTRDADEKGVKIIGYSIISKQLIEAIVEWK